MTHPISRRSRRRGGLLAACAALLAAAPAGAGELTFFESTYGAPGVSAIVGNGTGQRADIDFDASSAEGGALDLGATEIELQPTGSLVLTGFDCQLAGCDANDFVFTPGGEGAGAIRVSDPGLGQKSGLHDLGTVDFDAASGPGTLRLTRCNYIGADLGERACTPATLVTVPEPGVLGALAAGAALLFGPLGRARRRAAVAGGRSR